jgi:hypothetical protein
MDYYEQILKHVVAPGFGGLSGHEGYKAGSEVNEDWELFVEDHTLIHGIKEIGG